MNQGNREEVGKYCGGFPNVPQQMVTLAVDFWELYSKRALLPYLYTRENKCSECNKIVGTEAFSASDDLLFINYFIHELRFKVLFSRLDGGQAENVPFHVNITFLKRSYNVYTNTYILYIFLKP